jgi:hypothetical protein
MDGHTAVDIITCVSYNLSFSLHILYDMNDPKRYGSNPIHDGALTSFISYITYNSELQSDEKSKACAREIKVRSNFDGLVASVILRRIERFRTCLDGIDPRPARTRHR